MSSEPLSLEDLVRCGACELIDLHFARFCVAEETSVGASGREEPPSSVPNPSERRATRDHASDGEKLANATSNARDQPELGPKEEPPLTSSQRDLLGVLIALASRALRNGHPCLSLTQIGGQEVLDSEGQPVGALPHTETIRAVVSKSCSVTAVALGQEPETLSTPLVWDQADRLYLARYFEHERRLAQGMARLVSGVTSAPDPEWLRARLDHYFPPSSDLPTEDLQRRAADSSLRHRLCIVSGGPGTGKTSTVVKILALLVERALARQERPPRVLLLAPTGKAAARLSESVTSALGSLTIAEEVVEHIRSEALTIHRALGTMQDSRTRFARGPTRPLLADIVLVDEASMVDLSLMRHLVDALRPDARLILLGDRHQLASVEAGSVMAELCAALATRDGLVELQKSYRFSDDSGIAAFARAVKSGQGDRAVAELRVERNDLQFVSPPVANEALHFLDPRTKRALEELCVSRMEKALRQHDPQVVLHELGAFRTLCAHRAGAFGVKVQNDTIRLALVRRGLVPNAGEFYRGRLIMVSQNDYNMGLSNGDIGLCWPGAQGRLTIHFPSSGGGLRQIAPSQLPEHETAFALTIHKSQGSEYDEVAIVLPPLTSPLLTRELLYTAVTRAKKRAVLFGSPDAVKVACERSVVRNSGLSERLGALL